MFKYTCLLQFDMKTCTLLSWMLVMWLLGGWHGWDCVTADAHERDTDLDLTADEVMADGIVYRDKKSPKDQTQLEVAIGDGMEFTIHGEWLAAILI